MSLTASESEIQQQIDWLPKRNADRNKLGMLRRAIEEKWSKPDTSDDFKATMRQRREEDRKQARREAIEDQTVSTSKRDQKRQRDELKAVWNRLSADEKKRIESDAYARQNGEVLRRHFQSHEAHRQRECLKELDRQMGDSPSGSAGASPPVRPQEP
jgi:hypothetical protein